MKMAKQAERKPSYFSQWAGQFFVAAELTRREYTMAFPLGNVKQTDLLVESPKGTPFQIEVKTLRPQPNKQRHNFWLYSRPTQQKSKFYIFVHIDETHTLEHPRFYILKNDEAFKEWDDYYNSHSGPSKPTDKFWGAPFGAIEKYGKQDPWKRLPE
jgi:hypothetical protein